MTSPPAEATGVLAVDKPIGWTSHDVVAAVRRATMIRRIGHGGTLDPRATGVLPLLFGPATRFVERLHAAPKVYAAAVRFGTETATDDAEGPTRATAPVPEVGRVELDRALEAFRGETLQIPPDYAAVKVGGRRAYAVARAGAPVEIAPRAVRVDRLDVASWRPPVLRLLVVCGSGTYVRSLARDVGRALGSAAHLGALRRLAVGALDAAEALDLDELRAAGSDATLARLRPADDRLLELDARYRIGRAKDLLRGWEDP